MKIPRYGGAFFLILSCSPIVYYQYYYYYVNRLNPENASLSKTPEKTPKIEEFEILKEEILENFEKKNDRTIREFSLQKLDKRYNITWYASDKRPVTTNWTRDSLRNSGSSIFERWFENIFP